MTSDWKDDVRRMQSFDMTWRSIAISTMHHFPNETYSQVYERVRHIDKSHHRQNPIQVAKAKGTATLVFSDVHIPFNHPNFLQFLQDVYKAHNCGPVVCLGDLVDNHAISRHQTETCAKSPYDELDQTITEVAKYTTAFPKVKMVLGNHDLIHVRQAATLGIGERFLKTLNELLKLPAEWILDEEFIIGDVLYKHGINCAGINGAYNLALRERLSACIGHAHSFGGVSYITNKRNIIFGASCGCGIDINAYAFAYGTNSLRRPILGCTVVYDSAHAEFIPYPDKYFRN